MNVINYRPINYKAAEGLIVKLKEDYNEYKDKVLMVHPASQNIGYVSHYRDAITSKYGKKISRFLQKHNYSNEAFEAADDMLYLRDVSKCELPKKIYRCSNCNQFIILKAELYKDNIIKEKFCLDCFSDHLEEKYSYIFKEKFFEDDVLYDYTLNEQIAEDIQTEVDIENGIEDGWLDDRFL